MQIIRQKLKVTIQKEDVTTKIKSLKILREVGNPNACLTLEIADDKDFTFIVGVSDTIEVKASTGNDVKTITFTLAFIDRQNGWSALTAYVIRPSDTVNVYALDDSSRAVIQTIQPTAITSGFLDYPLSLVVEAASIVEATKAICAVTGADAYVNGSGAVTICDKKIIAANAVVKRTYRTDTDIFSLSHELKSPQYSDILINAPEDMPVYSTPSLTLASDFDPHPITPASKLVYSKSGQTYTVSPLTGRLIVYYSPTTKQPITWSATTRAQSAIPWETKIDYPVVEEFALTAERYVTVAGGINSLIAVELDGVAVATKFEPNYNVLYWDASLSGTLKVAYQTNILRAVMPTSQLKKSIAINLYHFDRQIVRTYKYDYKGYYPLPYKMTVSLIKDFNLESNVAVNAPVVVKKAGVTVGTVTADAFGEFEVTITTYGYYCLTAAGVTKYLECFINRVGLLDDKPKAASC